MLDDNSCRRLPSQSYPDLVLKTNTSTKMTCQLCHWVIPNRQPLHYICSTWPTRSSRSHVYHETWLHTCESSHSQCISRTVTCLEIILVLISTETTTRVRGPALHRPFAQASNRPRSGTRECQTQHFAWDILKSSSARAASRRHHHFHCLLPPARDHGQRNNHCCTKLSTREHHRPFAIIAVPQSNLPPKPHPDAASTMARYRKNKSPTPLRNVLDRSGRSKPSHSSPSGLVKFHSRSSSPCYSSHFHSKMVYGKLTIIEVLRPGVRRSPDQGKLDLFKQLPFEPGTLLESLLGLGKDFVLVEYKRQHLVV